jgi:3-isopropylmalate/(R)-2-methylmalate dehydratase small subunit
MREPFTQHTGLVAPMFQPNIDTDQIVPKKYLLKIGRTGFEEALFADLRTKSDGQINEAFVLNKRRYKGASILIAGRNFGCGSSREHASWALLQYGFRAVISPAFADIFYSNAIKNGLLPLVLDESCVRHLAIAANKINGYRLTIDLESQVVKDQKGFEESFEISKFSRHCLINALDDIALTLQHEDKITNYEMRARS